MTPQNDICPICNYGTSAIYCSWPSDEQIRSGVVPLDSLPAAWWNKMWADTTGRINEARDMVGQLITELNSVLSQAGICPQSACTDQLYQSINLIRQRLATTTVAGSVISSSDPSKVAVAADGTMSVNCLGNATALTTSAHTVVGAINELKSTYDCCISTINTCTGTLDTSKAPNMHASAATTYGVGNASCYGHVKLSDTYDSVLAACEGVAASQKALATAYTCMMACAGAPLGNTVGCALGTASAGVASTAARSDHVHPMPTCVANAGNANTVGGYGVSTGVVANTAVIRDANGYIYGSYFNAAIGDENINSYSNPVLMFSSGDCWIRRTSPANVCVGSAGNADTVDSYHASGEYDNTLFRALKGRDTGVLGCGYWGGMANLNVDGEGKWWHILSMDWSGGVVDPMDWASQLLLPTQQGGIPKYRFNANGGSTAISVSPWKDFITQDNIGSQSVCRAINASYAICADQARTATGANYAGESGSASSAGWATCAKHLLINGATWNSDWYYSGQAGQPSWLWGSNDGVNHYVWNPANFSVNYANSAGSANTADYAYRIGADGGRWVACCNPQYGYYCCIYNPNDFDILAILPRSGDSGCNVYGIAAHGWLNAGTSADTGRGIRLN